MLTTSRQRLTWLAVNLPTALLAGASPWRPAQDHGFMYGRSFEDPDGHHWEPMWMDASAAQQGAAALEQV